MKQRLTIPALSVGLGLAGFALRLLQNQTGFEADTGLPIPGNVPAILLPVLLAVSTAVLLVLAVRTQPKGPVQRTFSDVFHTENAGVLTVLVLGAFLMAASGLLELLNTVLGSGTVEYLTADGMLLVEQGAAGGRSVQIMGLVTAAAAVGIFPAVMACRRAQVNARSALAVHVLLLVRLIFAYRLYSVNPVLADYYVELLSLILLTLGFYRLSGFTVMCGSCRVFSVYAGMSAVLALTLLADGLTPAALLAVGGSAVLLGFQLLMDPAGCDPQPDTDPA